MEQRKKLGPSVSITVAPEGSDFYKLVDSSPFMGFAYLHPSLIKDLEREGVDVTYLKPTEKMDK